jgi:hypothetical protein
MATNKTVQTDSDVSKFLAKVADEDQRKDGEALIKMLKKVSGEPAKMWGPSIIGFGSYHYKYESGREGDMCRIGFSPRKGQTVLYAMGDFPRREAMLKKIGSLKLGKGCIYIKRLSDLDMGALEELCKESLAYVAKTYPSK